MTEDTDTIAEGAPEASTPELSSTTSSTETSEPVVVPEPTADVTVATPPIESPIYTEEHRKTYWEILISDEKAAVDYLEKIWAEIKAKL